MKIRLASIDDLPDLVEIYNEAIDRRFATGDLEPVTVNQRIEWFREHNPSTYPLYVLEEGDAVRGWCSLSAYRPGREALRNTAEISYYVSYHAHRKGFGSALVRHAVSEAGQLGKRVLFGIVLERNAASIRLLQKCGFELWGRLPEVATIDGERVAHLYYGRRV